MIKPHCIEYSKGFGKGRKEYSYIGTPGERCSDCAMWKFQGNKNIGGEGQCKNDKNALTWGGALCENFKKKKDA